MTEPLTPELLENYDILVIYTPTTRFTESEIEAVIDFVREGGGILVLGDHTNLLGSTAYLNRLIQKFGIQFNYDGTNALSTGYFSAYKPSAFFPHPIAQKISNFDFLSSCTLNAPILAEEVIIGYDLYSDPMDYSQPPNFFGKNFPTTNNDWGIFLQAASLKFGKGRVVAIGDGTPWSNFALFQGGHSELMMGAISFLNRRNHYGYFPNHLFLGLALVSLSIGTGFLLKLRKKRILVPLILVVILFSGLAAGWIFRQINKRNYTIPEPHTQYTQICFLKSHSNFKLPPGLGHSLHPPDVCFDVFYEWTQRVDYVPSLASSIDDAIKHGDAIVIINPGKSFSQKEQRKIVKYVNEGGRLLILDTILNRNSTANQLLTNFELSIVYRPIAHQLKPNQSQEVKSNNAEYSKEFYSLVPSIVGGNPVWNTQDDVVLFSIAQQGKGRIAAVVDSYAFSKALMGHPMDIPDPAKRKLYEMEFDIFENLFSHSVGKKQ